MKAWSIGLIALCSALTACNSKSSERQQNSADNAELATENAVTANLAVTMAPAPEGLPSRIAKEVITASGQKCDGVHHVGDRNAQDGTIVAKMQRRGEFTASTRRRANRSRRRCRSASKSQAPPKTRGALADWCLISRPQTKARRSRLIL